MAVDFEQYIIQGEPGRKERAENWQVAIGLQAVDGLKPSQYLLQTAQEHIEERISFDEVDRRMASYYQSEQGRHEDEGTAEADGVSARIARLLSEDTFTFSPAMLASVHRRLFEGILPRAGRYRQTNIKKKEWVLDGASVFYCSCDMISATLDYDFEQERMFSYKGIDLPRVVRRVSNFVSGIWQIHPFGEGNTRTAAVFAIKYLRQLGYKVDNEPFKEHSWYFRNALVRANYQNLPDGVERTTEFLELFFRNLLMGEDNELRNRYLHIRWKNDTPRASEECLEYGTEKMEIGSEKRMKSSEKILRFLSENPTATTEILAARIGISTRAVEKHLANLKAKGLLLRIGPDKGGHWEVVG
ncbi:MAG: Fic family protein [Bacteroidales bacterium]|nr:Fic family protein [Bacteroidales bacterium]